MTETNIDTGFRISTSACQLLLGANNNITVFYRNSCIVWSHSCEHAFVLSRHQKRKRMTCMTQRFSYAKLSNCLNYQQTLKTSSKRVCAHYMTRYASTHYFCNYIPLSPPSDVSVPLLKCCQILSTVRPF